MDEKTKDELIASDPKSAEILKPILRGRDIKRYGYEFGKLWVIGTFPALKLDIENYQAIKEYLLSFGKEKLEQSGKTLENGTKSRKKTGNKWFETQDQISYFEEFEKEKIVWQEMSKEPCFSYDNAGIFCNDTARILTGEKVKFFVGFFNSKFFQFAFSRYYSGGGLGGEGIRYKSEFMKEMPIPKITPQNQKTVEKIEALVEEILTLKGAGKGTKFCAPTEGLEQQIDELVFDLYDITPEEREVVLKS